MLKFASEEFLYLLLLVPAAVLFYYFAFKWKTRALARFGNLALVERLSRSTSRKRQVGKAALVVGSMLFLTLALAQPQIGTRLQEVKREGVDILVALDVSSSMLAEDIKPSRLDKAKHEIAQFIELLRGDRIGLIAFAGKAYVQCPLTLDYGAAKVFLDIMHPNLIPEPGTNIGDAIRVAMQSFESQERKYKALILVTDGEHHDNDVMKMVEAAEREGVVIYTVGIGSPKGVPIPMYDARGRQMGFKKDRQGNVVLTKLDQITLEKVAFATGGKFYLSATGDTRLAEIYKEIAKMEKKELAAMKFDQFEDRFQYLLIIAMILLVADLLISERVKEKKEWRGRFE